MYYSYMELPLRTLKYFNKENKKKEVITSTGGVIGFFQKVEWVYIFFIVGFIFGYVTIVIIWYLLGAIISPSVYLPYAAAAGTFATFCTTKISQFRRI